MFTFLQLSSQPVSQNNQICPDFPATHKGTFTDGTWWWRCGDTWRTYIVTYQTVQLLFSCHTTPTPRLQPQNPVVHEFTTLTKTLVNSHWTQHRGYIKNSWAYTTDTLMWFILLIYTVTIISPPSLKKYFNQVFKNASNNQVVTHENSK